MPSPKRSPTFDTSATNASVNITLQPGTAQKIDIPPSPPTPLYRKVKIFLMRHSWWLTLTASLSSLLILGSLLVRGGL